MSTGRQPRRNSSRDLIGRLATQSGPRTTAPMWPRPFLTAGEWAVYTALWSMADGDSAEVSVSHQELADLAWLDRTAVGGAIRRLDALGVLHRRARFAVMAGTQPNSYLLLDECPEHLAVALAEILAAREVEQAERRKRRRQPAPGLPRVPFASVPLPAGVDVSARVVYYIRRASDGAIKIGRSRSNLRYRLNQLSKDYGALAVLALETDTGITESARHYQFRALRLPHQGHGGGTEWFRPGSDLLAHIATMQNTEVAA